MVDSNGNSLIRTEALALGDDPSRINKFAFLLLCILPIVTTLLFGGVDTVTWLLVTILTLLLAALWLVESWRAGGPLMNTSTLQLPLAALALIGMVQIVPLGSYQFEGVQIFRSLSMDAFATKMFLTRLMVYLVFFAGCLIFVNSEGRVKKVTFLIVIFGAVMPFFGTIQRLSDPDAIYGLRATPQAIPFGSFVNQHHFAAFMEMCGGLTLGLLLGRRQDRNRKILLASALALMCVAIVLTGSRGGLIGLVSVGAFAAVLSFLGRDNRSETADRTSRVSVVLSAAAFVLVTLGVVLFIGGGDALLRGVGAGELTGDISSGRLHFWPIALKIFLAHPVIGTGFETFGAAFTRYDTWNGTFRVEQAHNDYLQIMAEAGILGLACVAGFVMLLVRNGLKRISSSRGFRREVAVGALAGCLGILIHSFFDFPLRTPSNAFFFLLLCTLATGTVAGERHKRRH